MFDFFSKLYKTFKELTSYYQNESELELQAKAIKNDKVDIYKSVQNTDSIIKSKDFVTVILFLKNKNKSIIYFENKHDKNEDEDLTSKFVKALMFKDEEKKFEKEKKYIPIVYIIRDFLIALHGRIIVNNFWRIFYSLIFFIFVYFFCFDFLFLIFEYFKNIFKNIFFYDNYFNYDNINVSVSNKNIFSSFIYFNNSIIFRLNHIVPFIGQNSILYSFNDICDDSNYKCKASFLEWLSWRRQFIIFWVRDFFIDSRFISSKNPFFIFKFWLIKQEDFSPPISGYPFNEAYVRRITILKTLLNPAAMSQFLYSLIEPTYINEYIYLEFLKSNLFLFFYEYGKYLYLPVSINKELEIFIIEKNIFYEYIDWSTFFFFYLKLLSFNLYLLDNLNIYTEVVLTDRNHYLNYYNRSIEFLKSLSEMHLYVFEDSRSSGLFISFYKNSSFLQFLQEIIDDGSIDFIFNYDLVSIFFFKLQSLLNQLKDLKNIIHSYGDSSYYGKLFFDRFYYHYSFFSWYDKIAVLFSSPFTYLFIYLSNFLGNCLYILNDNAYIIDRHLYRSGDWYYILSFKNKYSEDIFTLFTDTQRWSIFQDYLDNNILSNLNRWYDCDELDHGKVRSKDRLTYFMKNGRFTKLPWFTYEETWSEMSFKLEDTIDHPKYKYKYFFWEVFQKDIGKVFNINDDYLDKQAEIARGIKSRDLILRRLTFQKRYHRKRVYLGLGTYSQRHLYRRPRKPDLVIYTKHPLVNGTF